MPVVRPVVVTMMVPVILAHRIGNGTKSNGPNSCRSRVDRLLRLTVGVIGRRAARKQRKRHRYGCQSHQFLHNTGKTGKSGTLFEKNL